VTSAEEFTEFAEAMSPRLRRMAFLLCGDWHTGSGTVAPITTATNTAGKPIRVGGGPLAIVVTRDGRTVYVVSTAAGTVTPITTATNTPGKPISAGKDPFAVVIASDSHGAGHD
jgi:YVTN family beta-propeller protein